MGRGGDSLGTRGARSCVRINHQRSINVSTPPPRAKHPLEQRYEMIPQYKRYYSTSMIVGEWGMEQHQASTPRGAGTQDSEIDAQMNNRQGKYRGQGNEGKRTKQTTLTCLANRSPTVPPATLKNALPASPSRKRTTSMVAMLCANAHGIVKMKKKVKLAI